MNTEPTPFEELHGHIKTFLSRSDQYLMEAEENGDVEGGEKHARVSSVLKELDRLATFISNRNT